MFRRRLECQSPGCERRRWKTDMVKVTYHYSDWGDSQWLSMWVCQEHIPLEILEAM